MTESTPADPAALAPAEARAEIERLAADPDFRAELMGRPRPTGVAPNDGATARWDALHKVAAADAGTAAPAAAPAPTAPAMSIAEARAQLEALRQDPKFVLAYLNGGSTIAGRAAASQVERLLKIAAGGADVGPGKPAAAGDAAPGADGPLASPGEYRVQLPGGLQPLPELDSLARELAHGAGATQVELDQLAVVYEGARTSGRTFSVESGTAELVGKLGEGAARTEIEAARGVLRAMPAAQRAKAVEMLEQTGLGNDPAMIRQLARMAKRGGKR